MYALAELTVLDFSAFENSIGKSRPPALLNGLKNLKNLVELTVSFKKNQIENEAIASLGRNISHLERLTTLKLYLISNSISD
jgi:hypothetical protein